MLPGMSEQFADFLLADPLLRGLEREGYERPTPVQERVIPAAMEGADLLVCAATGSGKTAAFLLPIMQRFLDARAAPDGGTRALILVPTRELARQIQVHFLRLGSYTRITAGVITGGEPKGRQVATLRRNPEILVATPGRLLEHLGDGEAQLGDLEVLVLDEADRMLDMGFAEDVLAIIGHCAAARQSLLFSATLHHRGLGGITERVLRDPQTLLVDPVREPHPDIEHGILLGDDAAHKERLLLWLLQNETYAKALVFTNTREGAVAAGNRLIGSGLRTGILHGELDQRERNRIMGLLHGGQIAILVATDLAARGLDVPGIDLVINLDVPRSGDDYLHRSGRTGRAGERGIALSLVVPNEWNRMESIVRYLGLAVTNRSIPGMEPKSSGPPKRKGPRKSAGPRKDAPAKKVEAKVKDRARDRKNIGKRRKPTTGSGVEAGFAPPKKTRDE